MDTANVELATADGPMSLFEVKPSAGAQIRGAIVVIQEAFGVNEHIQDVTQRLAEAGYHAVAPHMFHRTGGGTVDYGDWDNVIPHFRDLDDEKILADVDAALAHVASAGWGAPQTGLVGFCFGGRVSFLVAAQRPLGAAVGFYGGGIVTARFPQFPALIDHSGSLKAPWLGLFGENDQSIPVEDVERLRTDLSAAGGPHEVVLYPGAGHGFFCDKRDSFEPKAAEDAWARTLAWFESHLAPPTVGDGPTG